MLTRLLGAEVPPSDARVAALQDAAHVGDPLADAVVAWLHEDPRAHRRQFEDAVENGLSAHAPQALAALFAEVERVPAWLDRAQLQRGGQTMLRHGLDGMTALSGALLGGYLGSAATKPLVGTGALVREAAQRLARTTRFVVHVADAGDVDRFSEAFKDAIRVRVMHAMVRRRLEREPGFPLHWGVPLSQRDMVATHLQFTMTYLLGVAALGRLDTPREWHAVLHLWRYVSYLLGVRDELLPKSVREGLELVAIFNATEPGPDEDGRALASALLQLWQGRRLPMPQWLVGRYLIGYARYVLGAHSADQLGIPRTGWQFVPPALALLRLPSELRQLVSASARERARGAGAALLKRHSSALMGRAEQTSADSLTDPKSMASSAA
jgi:hypothetical protein